MLRFGVYFVAMAALSSPAFADETIVNITRDTPSVTVETPDGPVEISRNQDTEHEITGYFAKTSRPCPNFCIQPAEPAEGVHVAGELEVLAALETGNALIIDSRTLEWHLKETIPGAVHIPYIEVAERLDELGCVEAEGVEAGARWACANARDVILFCNGAWCGQSPTAIRAMVREGYPASKIRYYRGGMQMWSMLGLTTVEGSF